MLYYSFKTHRYILAQITLVLLITRCLHYTLTHPLFEIHHVNISFYAKLFFRQASKFMSHCVGETSLLLTELIHC